ncbi:hypothetical protein IJD34_07160 [bacterium]|nr:hypothetical protein [bacterium]
MNPISFRANPQHIINNKALQNQADRIGTEATEILKAKFSTYVKDLRNEVGPGLRLNELSKAFDFFCRDLGLKATDCYKIFIECIKK